MLSKQVEERINEGVTRVWDLDKVLYDEVTMFQDVLIGTVQGTRYGTILFCDAQKQSCELTQKLYHEAMTIPALLTAEKLDNVLILGSSEGSATNICIEAGVKHIAHVDIDEACVKACARHLPYGYTEQQVLDYSVGQGTLAIPTVVDLFFEDGYDFVMDYPDHDSFDVIIMDLPEWTDNSSDPFNKLYEEAFLRKIYQLLDIGGVFITQAGSPSRWQHDSLVYLWKQLNKVFPQVTYFGMEEQNWAWLLGFTKHDPGLWSKAYRKLDTFPYLPRHIDKAVINKSIQVPLTLRNIPCSTPRTP